MSIGVAVITTKATLSKRAVDRNKARRRFYEALNAVVNRGAACPDDVNGWDLVSEGESIILSPRVHRPCHALPGAGCCSVTWNPPMIIEVC